MIVRTFYRLDLEAALQKINEIIRKYSSNISKIWTVWKPYTTKNKRFRKKPSFYRFLEWFGWFEPFDKPTIIKKNEFK